MAKKWVCDKGCHKTITWPEPYQAGNKPVNMDGSRHNCLPGGPDHIAGQVADAPPQAPPEETTQEKIVESPQTPPTQEDPAEIPKHLDTHPAGEKLENSYIEKRRALSLQVWHLAVHDAKQLVGDKAQLQVAQTLYLGMMSNL